MSLKLLTDKWAGTKNRGLIQYNSSIMFFNRRQWEISPCCLVKLFLANMYPFQKGDVSVCLLRTHENWSPVPAIHWCHLQVTWQWPNNDSTTMIAVVVRKKEKKKTHEIGDVQRPYENRLFGNDVLSDRSGPGKVTEDAERETQGEHKQKPGRKYGSYQHPPHQENRATMKAQRGRDRLTGTDREWRLKRQRDKMVGGRTQDQEKWAAKWTAAVKQETKKDTEGNTET